LNGGSGTFNIDTVPSWISNANLGVDTVIVAATFRSKFAAYYEARQQLLNKFARFFAENVGSGYTEIDGGKITSFEITGLKYIQAGPDEENYRLTAAGLDFRRQIEARISSILVRGACFSSYSTIIEVWYRWTENYSDASPDWSSWYHSDDIEGISGDFNWWIDATDPIYGATLTDFSMQFKFVLHSDAGLKSKLEKWNVFINDEPTASVEIDSKAQWQANADSVSGIAYADPGNIEPTNFSSTGTYISKASSITKEIEADVDASKVLHSIHQGTVHFDGSSGNMAQRIYHNKHISPDRYNVILNELGSQFWKSSFDPDTDYMRQIDVSLEEDYFDVSFYAEEGVTSENIGTVGMQSNASWYILANLTGCMKIEFDVYHWGGLRIFKEHVSHVFSSPYTGDIGYRYYNGTLSLSWNGDTTAEYEIEGLIGMVAARDIIQWTSGTKYPLAGTFRYEIQLWK